MKNILFVIVFFICSFCDILPDKFDIKESVNFIGDNFTILENDKRIGLIEERVLNLSTVFIIKVNDKVIAKSVQQLFSWGVEIKIYDENDNYIGKVVEDVWKSSLHIMNTYGIYDKNGKLVLTSEKIEVLKTDIELYSSNDKKLVAKIHRGYFQIFLDKWNVEVYDNTIDKRLFIFIPAFKTKADNKKKKE